MKKPVNKVDAALLALADALRSGDEYRRYQRARAKIEQRDGLKQQIDDYRVENFNMQQNFQGEELFHKTEEFLQKYKTFREDADVDEFLAAELSLVRKIQSLEEDLLDELDFE